MPSGIVVVDKPRGPTSHDVVALLRRAFKTRQVGHCGTLDPMATGVLVVAVDEGTKLVSYLTSEDKAYEATLRLGVATDSFDAEGNVTEEQALSSALMDDLEALERGDGISASLERAVATERARTEQIPPAFSAVRIDGERAHVLARRGEAPVMPARGVGVVSLNVVGGGRSPEPHLRLRLDVTKGYFVRSLARDLSAALGTVGHLTALRRTRSGAFTLDDAVSIDALVGPKPAPDDVEAAVAREEARTRITGRLVSLRDAARRALPVSQLSERGVAFAGHGKRIPPEDLSSPHPLPSAWLDAEGRLVAIGRAEADGTGRVLRGFPRSP